MSKKTKKEFMTKVEMVDDSWGIVLDDDWHVKVGPSGELLLDKAPYHTIVAPGQWRQVENGPFEVEE